MKICANDSCAHSKVTLNAPDDSSHVDYRGPDGGRVSLARHLYASTTTKFYLCEVCHNAVQMVMRGKT